MDLLLLSQTEPQINLVDQDQNDTDIAVLGTYASYTPSRLQQNVKHPSLIVETLTMASVESPHIYYKPEIPISGGQISDPQIEAIFYACQQHRCFLPNGERAGFLIGDGAGVGKGRIIAGILYENWLRGRRKSLWISVSPDLLEDCKRDLRDIGADKLTVFNVKDYSGIAESETGVLFLTYCGLIGASKSGCERIQQILEWLGSDFNGVIVFDECHLAKNLHPDRFKPSSKTAKAVEKLQMRLPDARVVYASATGASEIRHMCYMSRLGVWGTGCQFNNFADFLQKVENRDVEIMELIAMDLKLRGAYIARSLSFEGATFEVKHIKISKADHDLYNLGVEFWVLAFSLFGDAIILTNADAKAKNNIWRQFWGCHQRFFRYLIVAFKVQCVIEMSRNALKDGKCVVIGLQSTGESQTIAHVNKQCCLDGFISCSLGILQTLVETHFPVTDFTSPGKQIHDAVNLQNLLIFKIKELGPKLPVNTLDELIQALGGTQEIAEMTGRRVRLIKNANGSVETESRDPKRANLSEKEKFMRGEKLIAIISDAASCGISLHSDIRSPNQRRRVHITLELPWSAEKTIQQFGRTHRSNQKSAPEYVVLISDLAGEVRIASTVANRLKNLGALTQGDRRAADSTDLSQFNFDNKFGRRALQRIGEYILSGGNDQTLTEGLPFYDGNFHSDLCTSVASVGLNTNIQNNSVHGFLNRIMGLKVGIQKQVFNLFYKIVNGLELESKLLGRTNFGVLNLEITNSENVVKRGSKLYIREHATGSGVIELIEFLVDRGLNWDQVLKISKNIKSSEEGFYLARNEVSGKRLAVLVVLNALSEERGNPHYSIFRPNLGMQSRKENLDDIRKKYEKTSLECAQLHWTNQYCDSTINCLHAYWNGKCLARASGEQCDFGKRQRTYHLLTGSLLLCWDDIEYSISVSDRGIKPQLLRIQTDNKQYIGILIPHNCVERLQTKLGRAAQSSR